MATIRTMRPPAARQQRKTVEHIMGPLDAWVARHGNGQYEQGDWVPTQDFMIPDDAGIQQDRAEIAAFVELLLARGRLGTVLEVGLGYYGSTHFLWRLLFDKVITIEKSHERIRAFGTNLRAFHGRWVLGDRKSAFIIGMSNETTTVQKTYQCVMGGAAPPPAARPNGPIRRSAADTGPEIQAAGGGVDLLFIDGDHTYASVLTDWLLYSPLVRPGGLLAFHDVELTVSGHYGVAEFLERLSRGAIDGRPRTLEKIVRTKHLGIAFYEP